MSDTQAQSLRVTAEWRRHLRVWLANHDLSATDIAARSAEELLTRNHGTAVYIPPPAGDSRLNFDIPAELHARVVDAVTTDPQQWCCLLYTSPSPRDLSTSRMPSSA